MSYPPEASRLLLRLASLWRQPLEDETNVYPPEASRPPQTRSLTDGTAPSEAQILSHAEGTQYSPALQRRHVSPSRASRVAASGGKNVFVPSRGFIASPPLEAH